MTKRDLVMRISKETGMIQKDVATVLQKSLDYIIESLARGENVEFRNFGVFEVQERKSRIGRNPNKPDNVVIIPNRKVVKFKNGACNESQNHVTDADHTAELICAQPYTIWKRHAACGIFIRKTCQRAGLFSTLGANPRNCSDFSHTMPAVESLELLKRKGGEEIVGQIYAFKDKSDRELALRPEMTPTWPA